MEHADTPADTIQVPPLRRADLLRAFEKFNGAELDELRRHVAVVEILNRRSLVRAKTSWTLSTKDPRTRNPTSSEEALDAALPYVRQLWRPAEYGGFHRVRGMLWQHARDCAEGDHAKRLLHGAHQNHKSILKRGRYGYLLDEDGIVEPKRVLEAWLHGHLEHGNDRGRFDDLINGWTEGHHMILADVAIDLARFYERFASGPYGITAEPTLHG